MASLKQDWKNAGKDVIKALESVGKSLIRSTTEGIKIIDKWANEESSDKENINDSDNSNDCDE